MLNSAFDAFTEAKTDYYPAALRAEIDEINAFVYANVNNGVYRAGFARTQEAYEAAFRDVFGALDTLEERLSRQRYLLGNRITEADWRLFVTLVRFDAAYYGQFKCNLRRLDRLSEPVELSARSLSGTRASPRRSTSRTSSTATTASGRTAIRSAWCRSDQRSISPRRTTERDSSH